MSKQQRQVHINAFISATGHHEASWRHPDSEPRLGLDVRYYKKLAQLAEKGLFDSLFLADGYYGRTANKLEPFTLLSALAMVTEHIGLIATVGTTYNDPFHIARKFASLDYISAGRAGWNIVTTGTEETAGNFGYVKHPEHRLRYEIAEEFVEAAKQLWDSWEDDAAIYDKSSGVSIIPEKVVEIHFKGSTYSIQGPLNIPRPPQGYPVLVQAGSSESGRELAAKTAEVVFTAHQTIQESQSFYADVKSRLPKYGRNSEHLLILPGLSPILADTEAEARDIEEELNGLINEKRAISSLSGRLGVDLTDYDPDGPIPYDKLPGIDAVNGRKGRYQLVVDLAQRESLTIRQITRRLAGARGHVTFTGTPLQLADLIERWIASHGADGFNLMPQLYPSGLQAFVEKVVPELQNRGLFRERYEGTTLRENLGLARPVNARVATASRSGPAVV
ncbi:LLM class flavin-dependent oxidoreductase [Paenibacillus hemerocallicola]|uniref:LLM class flavin-dependent oxidoreductase n=1 Tax=Paenibacillus hemerocallicola TaxID=1172614 RepID=A0A5C4TEV5_9BACL|nr:LLM class flavin-dependent oxidoreductase [Paenibacillus hemerocallicola]TNJ66969.1 LLM class flavin-dependent oxidoreductase [Paenibacillus hemerocallicola]